MSLLHSLVLDVRFDPDLFPSEFRDEIELELELESIRDELELELELELLEFEVPRFEELVCENPLRSSIFLLPEMVSISFCSRSLLPRSLGTRRRRVIRFVITMVSSEFQSGA